MSWPSRVAQVAVGFLLIALAIAVLIAAPAGATIAAVIGIGGVVLVVYGLVGAALQEFGPKAVKFRGPPPAAAAPLQRWHSDESIAMGDGATRAFRTPTPFVSGTLRTKVDNLTQRAAWSDPATGRFELSFSPGVGEQVFASWQETGAKD